jgi:alkanesulfonate monooxygenase SsuD/methylene tetrahydromethanopterin reductase-like flavin-dependent oxidoreductase (luciferase family)
VPIELNVKALQGVYGGRTAAMRAQTLEVQQEKGVIMFGTPTSVVRQIKRFYDRVGGFDHLLMMQQAGHLDHQRTVRSMTLFAREVYPQIKDLAGTREILTRPAAE